MGGTSSYAMLEWHDRYLKGSAPSEESYHKAWQEAEELHRSGRISVKQWIQWTRLLNEALLSEDQIS